MANWKGLTLTTDSTAVIKINLHNVLDVYQYSLDDGATWSTFDTSVIINPEQQLCVRIASKLRERTSINHYSQFVMSGNVYASGNINSMLNPNFETLLDISEYDYAFNSLFYDCITLKSTPTLPSVILGLHTYRATFVNCSGLTVAPELPAIMLGEYCYDAMFSGCSGLAECPALPTITLAKGCYDGMFGFCTGIVKAPELPATVMQEFCYSNMFEGCTSLTKAPELRSTALANFCYYAMFRGCTSIVKPPLLPATTIPGRAYWDMFMGTGIKVSETLIDEYTEPWRFPTEGTGTAEEEQLDMFANTTGRYRGDGIVNTTYYIYDEKYEGLKFTANGNASVYLYREGTTIEDEYEYSLDDGDSWTKFNLNSVINLTDKQELCVRAKNPITYTRNSSNYIHFDITNNVSVSGNANSMITPDFEDLTNISNPYALYGLFAGCYNLKSAFDIELPAAGLSQYCYANMFKGCTNLTVPPELPSVSLFPHCYESMFEDCNSLVSAPTLPAATVIDSCYANMFKSCSSLITPPSLNANVLGNFCYEGMFRGCVNLASLPELPATTLAEGCYNDMFRSCVSLTDLPELYATYLNTDYYVGMFRDCFGIKMAYSPTPTYNKPWRFPPVENAEPASTQTNMFMGTGGVWDGDGEPNHVYYLQSETSAEPIKFELTSGSSTTISSSGELEWSTDLVNWTTGVSHTLNAGTPVYCRATTTTPNGVKFSTQIGRSIKVSGDVASLMNDILMVDEQFKELFANCTSITDASELKLSPTTLTESCYADMFKGCSSLVLVPELPASVMATNCYFGMFRDCTELQEAPQLPAMALANSCYEEMFEGCSYLIEPPELPATSLKPSCYEGMFSGCSFTEAPELPATVMASRCYCRMFSNCSMLESAPELNSVSLAPGCYANMFENCDGLYAPPTLPATTLAEGCYEYMFYGCPNLVEATALPAISLAPYCYMYMFAECPSLEETPTLPATSLAEGCYEGMFKGCRELTSIPELPATTLAVRCYANMFENCVKFIKPLPLYALTLKESCYADMFKGCIGMEISDELTLEFTEPYRVPAVGTGTAEYGATSGMFDYTGGPWYGTPEINKTYYLRTNDYKGLRIIANEDGYITLNTSGTVTDQYEYSANGGITWSNLPLNTSYPLNAGDEVCFRIKNNQVVRTDEGSPYVEFKSNNSISAVGNCNSMITPDFEDLTDISAYPYALRNLFIDCDRLQTPPELPATVLSTGCYKNMFNRCVELTEAPELPATTLAESCYEWMFYACEKLTEAPELPATSLAEHCYGHMFHSCREIAEAPALPTMILKLGCYEYMFNGCTSITKVPELPAVNSLARDCYAYMFAGCTGLTEPSRLPALYLYYECYEGMFYGCTGIEISDVITEEFNRPYRIPIEGTGATEGGWEATDDMFSATGGPWTGTPEINRTYYLRDKSYKGLKLKAETDIHVYLRANGTINDMYEYSLDDGETWEWLRLTDSSSAYSVDVPAGSTMCVRIQNEMLTRSNRDFVQFYIDGVVSASGNVNSMITPDFEGVTDISKYNYALRNLFNSIDYLADITKLELPATTLSQYCYANMFQSCHNITEAPVLPATNLAMACYSCMFAGTSLDIPPELPATTMSEYCYNGMFHASLITKVPELPATVLADFCYSEMFELCPNIDTPPALPAQTLKPYCYYKMFYDCGKIKMSDVMTDEYNVPYIIPSEGVGTSASSAMSDMFELTTGPWHSTPAINTVYYLKGKPKEGIYHWTGTRWKLDGNVCESKAAVSDKGMHHWTGTRWKLDGNVGGVE